MRISAITQIKQGDIWEALQKANMTQTQLAKETGISYLKINQIINLYRIPKDVDKILKKFKTCFAKRNINLNIDNIIPKDFKGFEISRRITVTKDIPIERMLSRSDRHLLDNKEERDISDLLVRKEQLMQLKDALKILTEIQKFIIIHRYGLNKEERKTLREIAPIIDKSFERVRQIEHDAIRKLRRYFIEEEATKMGNENV